MTVNQIYRQDSRGVVDIKVSTTTTGPLGLSTQQAQAEGAGGVYNTEGDILTDEHVAQPAAATHPAACASVPCFRRPYALPHARRGDDEHRPPRVLGDLVRKAPVDDLAEPAETSRADHD